MSTPEDQAQSENTYVIDPESGIEMGRLMYQDKLITQTMGGLLEDIPRVSQARRILDVACGPGAWALEVAFSHPKVEVVGFNLSNLMVQYANAQAKAQKLSNARFVVMDVHKPLEFPDRWFDIVNARFISRFMRKEDWPGLVGELGQQVGPCTNICAPSQKALLMIQIIQVIPYASQRHTSLGLTITISFFIKRSKSDAFYILALTDTPTFISYIIALSIKMEVSS